MTLAALCKRVRKMGFDSLADGIKNALAPDRNATVRRYFWEKARSAKLQTVEGRAELCAELTAIATRCNEVETVLRALVPFDAQMWTQTEMTVVALFEQQGSR
jgi:hypothetical protein